MCKMVISHQAARTIKHSSVPPVYQAILLIKNMIGLALTTFDITF